MDNKKRNNPDGRRNFLNKVGILSAATLLAPLTNTLSRSAEKPDKKIRVGVIGCGSVSNRYLPHLKNSPFVELVSTCDIIPERARKQAEQFGIANYYPHIDQLLKGVPFDLLIDITDMQEHGRLNKIAILAGKHVWSEKPLANSYAEGKELVDLARQKGVRVWGAPAVVQSPQFAFMARVINEKKLGYIAAAHAHYGHLGPDWSAFFYEKGGGSMPDLGVYNIATLTGLLGPARSVVAMLSIVTPTRVTQNKGEIKVEAEDNAMILLEHEFGIISHVQCGFNYFDPFGHEAKGQERPSISILGRGGAMHLIGYDWEPFGVEMTTPEQPQLLRHVPDAGDYVWQMGASIIAECLATGKEPLINVEHSLHVLEIIQAARESQANGKRIQLQSAFKWPIVT